jgi:DNA-binding transcriptional regulator YiaG
MDTEDERKETSYGVVVAGAPAVCEEPDEVLRKLRNGLESRIQAFRESERLSEADFAIRINVRGD